MAKFPQGLKLCFLEMMQQSKHGKFVDALTKLEKSQKHFKSDNFGLGGSHSKIPHCKLHYAG